VSGARRSTRRALTAGALAPLGAVLGTAAGYVVAIGWFRSSRPNGGVSALASTPTMTLVLVMVGMPLIAPVAGWLLAGREPSAIAQVRSVSTISTLHGEWWATLLGTLPRANRLIPLMPRLPTTTTSAFTDSATLMSTSAGSPSRL